MIKNDTVVYKITGISLFLLLLISLFNIYYITYLEKNNLYLIGISTFFILSYITFEFFVNFFSWIKHYTPSRTFILAFFSHLFFAISLIPNINNKIFGGTFDLVIKKDFYKSIPFNTICENLNDSDNCIMNDVRTIWNQSNTIIINIKNNNIAIKKSDVIALIKKEKNN